MTTEAIESRGATEAELAAAQAEAALAYERGAIKQGDAVAEGTTIPGAIKPMTYSISEADKGAWVPVWELKVDANGLEYGVPTRAPRQQLGLWLQKRREFDGGIRFTVNQPKRVAGEAQFKCLHQDCRKKLYTRLDLVDHVENAHPRDARLYRSLLDEVLKQAAEENPRVRELAETYAGLQEKGIVSIEVNPTPRQEQFDLTAGAPVVSSVGGFTAAESAPEIFLCRKEGCKRFFDTEQGRTMHESKPH